MRIAALMTAVVLASAASAQPPAQQAEPKKNEQGEAKKSARSPKGAGRARRAGPHDGDIRRLVDRLRGLKRRRTLVRGRYIDRSPGPICSLCANCGRPPSKEQVDAVGVLVPVNVTTTSPVEISADAGKSELNLPFRSCAPGGCVAQTEVTKEQLQALGKTQGQLILVEASGKSASVEFSLRGLDQALEAYFRRQEQ